MKKLLLMTIIVATTLNSMKEGISFEERQEISRQKNELDTRKKALEDELVENNRLMEEAVDASYREELATRGSRIGQELGKATDIIIDYNVLLNNDPSVRGYKEAFGKIKENMAEARRILTTDISEVTNPAVSGSGSDIAYEEIPTYAPAGVRFAYDAVRAWMKEKQATVLALFAKTDSAIKVRTELQGLYASTANAPKVESNVDQLNQLYNLQVNKNLRELTKLQDSMRSAPGTQRKELIEKQLAQVEKLFLDALRYRNQLEKTGDYFEKHNMLKGNLKTKFDSTVKVIDDAIDSYKKTFNIDDSRWQGWQDRIKSVEPSAELKTFLDDRRKFFERNPRQAGRLQNFFGQMLNAKSLKDLNEAMGSIGMDINQVNAILNTNLIDSSQALIKVREYELGKYMLALEQLAELMRAWARVLRSDAGVIEVVGSQALNDWAATNQDVPDFIKEIYSTSDEGKRTSLMRAKANDLDTLAEVFTLMAANAEQKLKNK